MTHYFLFGQLAVETYNVGIITHDDTILYGVEALLWADEENMHGYEVFAFDDLKHSPQDLLRAYGKLGRYCDFITLTEEEYNQLN